MVRSDRLYIGGSWVTPSGTETVDVINPTTEKVIGSVPMADPADADRAVRAATLAFAIWRMSTIAERVKLLRDLADGLRARSEELTELITDEVGSPLGFSRDQQVGLPIKVVDAMADLLPEIPWVEQAGTAEVVREPIGVVVAITPWNYPLHQAVLKVAAALAAGCTVILKPSEVAPLSAFVLAEILDGLGLPAGAFNLVSGTGPVAGEALVRHPMVDMISLTGSTRAGQRIMELAAPSIKKVALELGGKSATVVLDDADIAKVVPGAVAHAFRNTGQNCSALSRLIVPRARLAEVEAIAADVAGSWSVGDPHDAETQMGPLVTSEHRDRVLGMVEAAVKGGARLIAGGIEPPEGLSHGYFVRPTVFSAVDVESELAQEEVFGPVLSIFPADDTDDAVRIANSTRYGLSGAVWSADAGRARDVALRMRTGRVTVNGGPFSVYAPFGGRGQSGVGAEFGKYGIEEFLVLKTLQI
ncbi:MAG TPA: aldehyde dehydrogenase family protein [Pseudolysinimonas sp.]|jgi:betaine-aldehyde dehydrogenase